MVGRRPDGRQLLGFTAAKYLTYALQAVRGLVIAKVLGPTLFGLWGIITLVQQYFSYTHLGVHVAANVELSTKSRLDISEVREVVSPVLGITLAIGIALIVAVVGYSMYVPIRIENYGINGFVVALAFLAVFQNYYQVAMNVQRVYGNLLRINLAELLVAAIPLCAVPFFEGLALVRALIWSMIGASVIGLLVLTTKSSFAWRHSFAWSKMSSVLRTALPLFVLMVSTYLLLVGTRTIVGVFYDLESLAYYSLANSLATASTLGIHAISWAINPLILHKFRPEETSLKLETVERVSSLYRSLVFLVTGTIVFLSPLLFVVLDKYRPARGILVLLLVGQMINSFGYGFNTLAIARKRLSEVTRLSLLALGSALILALAASYANLPAEWVALSTIVGGIVYTTTQNSLGRRILSARAERVTDIMRDNFKPQVSIPVVLLVASGFLPVPYAWSLAGLMLYIVLNYASVRQVFDYAIQTPSKSGRPTP
jgi:O-antigen/teichoic acid export membrane protein